MKKMFLLAFMPLALMACSGSDNKEEVPDLLPRTDISVDFNKTVDIGGSGSLVIKKSFIASYEDGWLKGEHVGTTEAVYNGSQQVKITVNSTLRYIDYPITDWGASKSAVFSQQKTGELLESKDNDDMEFFIVKSGSRIKYTYGYSFKNGQLESAMVMVPSTDTDMLVDWLTQKYYMMMAGNDPTSFFSGGFDGLNKSEATTLLGVSLKPVNTSAYVSSIAYVIIFTPIDIASRANNNLEETYLNAFEKRCL